MRTMVLPLLSTPLPSRLLYSVLSISHAFVGYTRWTVSPAQMKIEYVTTPNFVVEDTFIVMPRSWLFEISELYFLLDDV